MTDSYKIGQAAKLSGLTTHMVNYLCREKLLEPSAGRPRGRGRPRAYSFGDVVMLRALKRLLDSGISVAKLKRGLRVLRKQHPEITPKTVPSRFLVTDGRSVYFREERDVLEALDGSGQFSFAYVVEINQVRNEVLQATRAGGKR